MLHSSQQGEVRNLRVNNNRIAVRLPQIQNTREKRDKDQKRDRPDLLQDNEMLFSQK